MIVTVLLRMMLARYVNLLTNTCQWYCSVYKCLYNKCTHGPYGLLYSEYGSLPKTSNTLNIRTPKIIAKYNFKMFPKISNSG